MPVPVQTDASGYAAWRLPIPSDPLLVGRTVYLQAFVVKPAAGDFSGGIATRISP